MERCTVSLEGSLVSRPGRGLSDNERMADVGYEDLETDDAGAALAADFAVKEQSDRTKTSVKLGEIVKAECVASGLIGRRYRLRLEVLDEKDAASVVEAEISVDNYSNHKLLGWVPIAP